MTRTERRAPHSHKAGGTGQANENHRQHNISRAISKLLRHQAQHERVAITSEGWVKVKDLLAWRGLTDKRLFDRPVTLQDIIEVVEHDGIYGKGRFGIKLVDEEHANTHTDSVSRDATEIGERPFEIARGGVVGENLDTSTLALPISPQSFNKETSEAKPASKNNAATLAAIAVFYSRQSEASEYLIRANQGHSIKSIESDGLLTQITLDDPSTIPAVVVHGTFYGAWEPICQSGGLKPMGRNLVHFATGPSLLEILPDGDNAEPKVLKSKIEVDQILDKNKVVSGMRWDAQILIYVDLKRCLEDTKAKGLDMKWYKSENGVILTEGVVMSNECGQADVGNRVSPHQQASEKQTKALETLVPLQYWSAAVEVKAGLGLLWQHGIGHLQELPQQLRHKPLPHGKQRPATAKPHKKIMRRSEREPQATPVVDNGAFGVKEDID